MSATAAKPRGAGIGGWVREHRRDPNAIAYVVLLVVALVFPEFTNVFGSDQANLLVDQAADAGVYVLMAIGLNVVIGFAGLLDLGYAAFFAIGAYTYGMLASNQLAQSPIHHAIHLPFWLLLLVGIFIASLAGAALGAPTLRLRGDYLAIVTLGFGEIVPRVFKNEANWTGGVNAISAIDAPSLPAWLDGPWDGGASLQLVQPFQFNATSAIPWYVLMVGLIILAVLLVTNLQRSRLGRAWMAIREDEVAAAAMGINTRNIKLLAFSIGAATSGFAGAFYGAKLSLVSPDNFSFTVSVTVLMMVTLGGMGNVPGVILGALLLYFIEFSVLGNLAGWVTSLTDNLGLAGAHTTISNYVSRLNFLVLGILLVSVMLLRPQGLLPSRARARELHEHTGGELANTEGAAGG
ncbi:MAG: branched-chain amino acid ABC transporter permease [Candidatus Dormiibacterota bacterium]